MKEKSVSLEQAKFRYTIIIGCSRLGASLATQLSEQGEEVTVIDKDRRSFSRLSGDFGGLTIVGDAAYLDILEAAEIKRATAVVCVTDYDNTNILVAQLVKELYGVEQVVARLYDQERQCVYQEFNIVTICPPALSALEITNLLNHPGETQ